MNIFLDIQIPASSFLGLRMPVPHVLRRSSHLDSVNSQYQPPVQFTLIHISLSAIFLLALRWAYLALSWMMLLPDVFREIVQRVVLFGRRGYCIPTADHDHKTAGIYVFYRPYYMRKPSGYSYYSMPTNLLVKKAAIIEQTQKMRQDVLRLQYIVHVSLFWRSAVITFD